MQGVRSDGIDIPMRVLADNATHLELAYTDVVRNKTREGIVSFCRPCFYHFRTKVEPAETKGAPVNAAVREEDYT